MAEKSPIKWTIAAWNPVTGYSIAASGCRNYPALRCAGRLLDGVQHTEFFA